VTSGEGASALLITLPVHCFLQASFAKAILQHKPGALTCLTWLHGLFIAPGRLLALICWHGNAAGVGYNKTTAVGHPGNCALSTSN
jgi:hypothetical protein